MKGKQYVFMVQIEGEINCERFLDIGPWQSQSLSLLWFVSEGVEDLDLDQVVDLDSSRLLVKIDTYSWWMEAGAQ